MAIYTVKYEMRKGNVSSTGLKTVTAESEATAIRIVEDQARSQRLGYDFILKEVKRK